MQLEEAIFTRRSARRYRSDPLPEGAVERMLEAARRAPSGGNGQEHVFGVVSDPALKRALAKAAGGQMWIAEAPVVFACCARLEADPRTLPEDDFGVAVNRLRWGGEFYAHLLSWPRWSDAATLLANATPLIPGEHIFLTAVSMGLSACFVGWLDVKEAGRILRLPPDMRCLFLMPVGYAAETPKPKDLKSLDEIAFYDTYAKSEKGE